MCNCNNNCSVNAGYQPPVCVKDLSRSAQEYIAVKLDDTGIADGTGVTGAAVKLNNMTRLTVDFCIKLDQCCTSKISVETSTDFIRFLTQAFVPVPAEPDNIATQSNRAQKFLTGKYTCSTCC